MTGSTPTGRRAADCCRPSSRSRYGPGSYAWLHEQGAARTPWRRKGCLPQPLAKLLWVKGESSGNYLEFVDASTDCDRDTILVQARPAGLSATPASAPVLETCRRTAPGSSRRSTGWCANAESRCQSQATPLAVRGRQAADRPEGWRRGGGDCACAHEGRQAEIAEEAGDLIYHLLVLLADAGMSFDDCVDVLQKRNAADMKGGKVKGDK